MGAEHCGAYNRVHTHCTQALLDCCGATKLSSSCYNCYSLVHFSGCLPPRTVEERRDDESKENIKIRYQSRHFKSINSGTMITADGALAFGIRLAGRGTLFCLLYSAHRLHKLWPMLSRRQSGVSELAQFTFI